MNWKFQASALALGVALYATGASAQESRRRAAAGRRRGGAGHERRGQAGLHAGGLRALRAEDGLRHAGPGAGLHDPPGGPGARARPGIGERADQRPAHRQQDRRRDRRAAAGRRGQRRADRDRRCLEPRHRRAVGPGGERDRGAAEGRQRPVRMAARFPRALMPSPTCCAARSAIPTRPGRSNTRCRSTASPGAVRSAARSRSPIRSAIASRIATKCYHSESWLPTFQTKFAHRRPGIVARQPDARLHAVLGPFLRPRGSHAGGRRRAYAHHRTGARRLLRRLQRRLFVQGRARARSS